MLGAFQDFARRLTRSANAIKLPSHRRRHAMGTTHVPAAGPVLVRGRGIARRRRRPLARLFRFLFG
ncbi:MAG TPA: hypothetical protein VFY93_06080 [Planctomycetota bacterium]|nr:hypothetical protein [Planctomycetota bacterium]